MGWFSIRVPRMHGDVEHWRSISLNAAGPEQFGEGLLHVRMPDGAWASHVAPDTPNADPLMLNTWGAWEIAAWFSRRPLNSDTGTIGMAYDWSSPGYAGWLQSTNDSGETSASYLNSSQMLTVGRDIGMPWSRSEYEIGTSIGFDVSAYLRRAAQYWIPNGEPVVSTRVLGMRATLDDIGGQFITDEGSTAGTHTLYFGEVPERTVTAYWGETVRVAGGIGSGTPVASWTAVEMNAMAYSPERDRQVVNLPLTSADFVGFTLVTTDVAPPNIPDVLTGSSMNWAQANMQINLSIDFEVSW